MEFSNSKLCFILLLSTAILSTSIAHAATGTWIDSIDSPDTASPGEVVQVDMVVDTASLRRPRYRMVYGTGGSKTVRTMYTRT